MIEYIKVEEENGLQQWQGRAIRMDDRLRPPVAASENWRDGSVRILVDADSCPTIRQIEDVARWHDVPVTLFCNTDHLPLSDYAEVRFAGAGKDAADYELVRMCDAGDVVITQDHRLASMALGRRAHVLHWDGRQYTSDGPAVRLGGRLLFRRAFLPQKASKRIEEDDQNFMAVLDRLLAEIAEKNEDNAYRLWAESAGRIRPK